MIVCKSGRTIIKNKSGEKTYVLRLNLIEYDPTDQKKTKYRTKEIFTGLSVNKANLVKANAMLAEEITKYSAVGENMLFHQYCEHWLERKKAELEQITYESYACRIAHIISYFKQNPVPIGKLSAEDADGFYHYLLTVEKSCPAQRAEHGLSNRTIKDIAVLFRAILTDAMELDHVKDRHKTMGAIKRKVPKKPEETAPKAYIGQDEVATFLDAIHGHPLELAYLLALFFGLRREEILGLKWGALRDGRLYVEHTVSKLKSTVAKDRTKTDASRRDYPIPSEIMTMFARLYEEQQKNQELCGNAYQSSDYIFVWPDGHLYSPDYLTKAFKKLVRENDQLDSSLTLHSLRASCVSILIHSGMDIKDVQTWVGHSDVQTTLNIYARTNEKQQKKVMDCMTSTLLSSDD